MGTLVEISVQGRGRKKLSTLAQHDRYPGHTEPDGTIILEQGEIISVVETRLLADSEHFLRLGVVKAGPRRGKAEVGCPGGPVSIFAEYRLRVASLLVRHLSVDLGTM